MNVMAKKSFDEDFAWLESFWYKTSAWRTDVLTMAADDKADKVSA